MKANIPTNRLVLVLTGLVALYSSLGAEEKVPVKPYPLKLCIVTDNDLGSMGDERSFIYEGQEIKICCKPCERKFLKSPEKYMAKLGKEPEAAGRPVAK